MTRILELSHVDPEAAQAAALKAHLDEQERLRPFMLRHWGVGLLEQRILLAGARPSKAIEHARAFCTSTKQSLVLWGHSGGGKSVAAGWWLMSAARRPLETSILGRTWEWDGDCLFLPIYELARIQGSYDPDDKELMQRATTCRALVLDELGGERREVGSGLLEIISERNRFERKTVITGNLSPYSESFVKRYDERVTRRLRQFGSIHECGGGRP